MKLSILFFGLAFLSVMFFVLPDISEVQEKMFRGQWVGASATVDSVRIVRTAQSVAKTTFLTFVDYRYSYGDQEYRGTDVAQRNEILPSGVTDEHVLANKVARFPKGMVLAIRVDVAQPKQSWVSAFHEKQFIGVLMGVGGAAVFLVLAIVFAVRSRTVAAV